MNNGKSRSGRQSPPLVRVKLRLPWLVPGDHVGGLADVPVLLLTGTDDPHAPPRDAERLCERFPGERELYLVEGAGHHDVCAAGGPAYEGRLLDFLARRLAA